MKRLSKKKKKKEKIQQSNPDGPGQNRASIPNQRNWKFLDLGLF